MENVRSHESKHPLIKSKKIFQPRKTALGVTLHLILLGQETFVFKSFVFPRALVVPQVSIITDVSVSPLSPCFCLFFSTLQLTGLI